MKSLVKRGTGIAKISYPRSILGITRAAFAVKGEPFILGNFFSQQTALDD